jgi:O-antigen biosynthesis protein WbqP
MTLYSPAKRAIDISCALVGGVIALPLLGLVALGIYLDDPGPLIFRQERVGHGGRHFILLKFRTMVLEAPNLSTAEMQRLGKSFYTRSGRLLRKTSLDELPQLWNVLTGDMSIVGPRPALPSQTDVNELRDQMGVHQVRPGITGLAQVMGRDELDVQTKVNYDADYCRRMSLWLDLCIFAKTFTAVFTARGNK